MTTTVHKQDKENAIGKVATLEKRKRMSGRKVVHGLKKKNKKTMLEPIHYTLFALFRTKNANTQYVKVCSQVSF